MSGFWQIFFALLIGLWLISAFWATLIGGHPPLLQIGMAAFVVFVVYWLLWWHPHHPQKRRGIP